MKKEIIINNRFHFDLIQANNINVVYGELTKDYIKWAQEKTCYLATMPRSGTNFLRYFFNYFAMALLGEIDDFNDTPIPIERALDGWQGSLDKPLGIRWFLISHNYCPGFEATCDYDFLMKWNGSLDGKWTHDIYYMFLIDYFKQLLYPSINKHVKIVFVYRNPLDQIISFSRHHINHIKQDKKDKLNTKINLQTFINRYIKLYLTYDYMKKKYPDNIKMVSYEKLMQNPKKELMDILSYFDFDLSKDNRMELFEKTLKLVTPEALRKLELKMGDTLAGDQKVSSLKESHLRGGKIGRWKEFFSEDEIYIIEKRFNEFGLTLNQFDGIDFEFYKNKLEKFDVNDIIIDKDNLLKVKPINVDIDEKSINSKKGIALLLHENYKDKKINIVRYKNKFYAIPQSLGTIKLEEINEEDLDSSVIISDDLDKLLKLINNTFENNTNRGC